jgi:hypothetical protein
MEGGFTVRFEGAKTRPQHCYAVKFDYDEWTYALNEKPKRPIPKGTKSIIDCFLDGSLV